MRCRHVEELAYRELITEHLPPTSTWGRDVRDKLIYYPTVTRGAVSQQRPTPTDLLRSGKLQADVGWDHRRRHRPFHDCGSPTMLQDICSLLDSRGLREARQHGEAAEYVIERAFVES